jgi:hypothetical protein
VGVEQGVNELAELAVVAAQLVQIGRPLLGRHLQSGINDTLFGFKRGGHGKAML